MAFGPSPPRPAHHEISIPPVGPQSSQGENEVSAVGAAALSRVQHVPNEAAEEDDDHAGGQEKSEICVVDHALPPEIGLDVITFSARHGGGLPFAYMHGTFASLAPRAPAACSRAGAV
jgi:hypothetical protein